MKITLPFQYDFDRVLERLSLDPLHAVSMPSRNVLVPMAEGNVVELKAVGSLEKPIFEVNNLRDGQMERISDIFHFEKSLDPVNAHFQNTSLAQLFQEHQGTPIVREFSYYGSLMKSIIHQQLNLSFAHTLTSRFVQTYGHEAEGAWFYPSPEAVAKLEPADLRAMQFSTRKAEYVIGLSQAIASGELKLEEMEGKPDEEIIAELIAYRGVGPWTAQSFLLFGLGRPNLFPIADIGLQNALKIQWQLAEKPKAEEIMRHMPEWSPYLSYAALYLWRSIE